MKLIFAVLDVSLTMGLTRCYKTEVFLHLYYVILILISRFNLGLVSDVKLNE